MEQVSARFLAEIRKSHTVYSYVDITSTNQQQFRLPVTSGDVQVDRTADVRRRCSVTCIDPSGDLVPQNAQSILTPYGTEIRPYRGVKYADGTTETVPLGVFRIAKVSVNDTVGGSPDIKLEAYDLSRTVQRNKFTSPYVIAVGTNVITAIKAILSRTLPDLNYDSISTALVTTGPIMYDVSDDPWKAVTDLATTLGCEIFFNAKGWAVIAPSVDIDALPSPNFTYIEGQGCTMLDLDRVFSDEPGYNGVIVSGESTGDELPPVRAVVWDSEPSSPTYHLGPYGEVPLFVTNSIVKTVDDASAAAAALLSQQLGFSSQLSISTTVNPALDCSDVVQVIRERTAISGLYAIDAVTVPLAASSTQALTLRQKRDLR